MRDVDPPNAGGDKVEPFRWRMAGVGGTHGIGNSARSVWWDGSYTRAGLQFASLWPGGAYLPGEGAGRCFGVGAAIPRRVG